MYHLIYRSPREELEEIKRDLETDLEYYRQSPPPKKSSRDRRKRIAELKAQIKAYADAIGALAGTDERT